MKSLKLFASLLFILILPIFCLASNDSKPAPKTKPTLSLSNSDLEEDAATTASKKKSEPASMKESVKEDDATKKEAEETKPAPKKKVVQKFVKFDDFELPDLSGKKHSTKDLREGKWAIIKFGASWCPPCRMETDELKKVVDKYPDTKVTVIEISIESVEDAKKYHEKTKATWTNLVDADSAVSNKFNITGIPTVFILNPDGEILKKGYFTTFEQIKQTLVDNGY